MSIATEIARLQTAKSNLETSIINKGVTVPSETKMDELYTYVDDIPVIAYEDDELSIPCFFRSTTTSGGVGILKVGNPGDHAFQYSYDKETWYDFTPYTTNTYVYFSSNNTTIYWRGAGEYMAKDGSNYYKFIFSGSSAVYYGGGNIMSLLYGSQSLTNYKTLTTTYSFYRLFYNDIYLLRAPKIPATTLTEACYSMMFYGCTALIECPNLPATTVPKSAYNLMFYGCTSLKRTCELPANIVGEQAYRQMFHGCTNLVACTKSLPATNIGIYCYYQMFRSCSNLVVGPEIEAKTLTDHCCYMMFSGDTSLTYLKLRASDSTATDCMTDWLNNVSSSGRITLNINVNIPSGSSSGVPTGWSSLGLPF